MVLRRVGDECDRAILEDTYCRKKKSFKTMITNRKRSRRTVFNLAPFLEMSSYDLFCLRTSARFFDAPNIKRAVLPCESADATHVVAIVGKLVARKAVLARIGQCAFWVRERVQVLALPAIWTAPSGKEEAAIAYAGCVCTR